MFKYRVIETIEGFKIQYQQITKILLWDIKEDWKDLGFLPQPIKYYKTLEEAKEEILNRKQIFRDFENPKVVYSD